MICNKCNLGIETGQEQVFYKNHHYHRNCFLALFERPPSHSVTQGPANHTGLDFVLLRDTNFPVDMRNYDPSKDQLHTVQLSTTDIELLSHTIQSSVNNDSKLQRLYGRLQIKLSESNEFAHCQRKECVNHKQLVRIEEMVEGEVSRHIILALAKFMPFYKSKSKIRKVLLFCSVECDELYSKKAEAIKIQLETLEIEQVKKAKEPTKMEPTKEKPLATASAIKEAERKKTEDTGKICVECKQPHATFQCEDCEKLLCVGHCAEKHNVMHYDEEQARLRQETKDGKIDEVIEELATNYAIIEEHLESLTIRRLRKLWYITKRDNGDYHSFEGKRVPIQDWKDMITDVISVKLEEKDQR